MASDLKIALISGGMYDRLYARIPQFEQATGVAVAVEFTGTHPELNAHLAALDPVPYDLISTHTKYAPSQQRFLAPLEGFDNGLIVFPAIGHLEYFQGLAIGIAAFQARYRGDKARRFAQPLGERIRVP